MIDIKALLHTASHNLKQPLATTQLMLGLIESQTEDETIRQAVEQAQRSTHYAQALLLQLLAIARDNESAPSLATSDLVPAVEALLHEHRSRWPGIHINFVPSQLQVHCNEYRVINIVDSLLAAFSNAPSTRTVHLHCMDDSLTLASDGVLDGETQAEHPSPLDVEVLLEPTYMKTHTNELLSILGLAAAVSRLPGSGANCTLQSSTKGLQAWLQFSPQP